MPVRVLLKISLYSAFFFTLLTIPAQKFLGWPDPIAFGAGAALMFVNILSFSFLVRGMLVQKRPAGVLILVAAVKLPAIALIAWYISHQAMPILTAFLAGLLTLIPVALLLALFPQR